MTFINEVKNTEVNNAKDLNVVMPMHNLIDYSHNYSEKSRSLWQYCRNKSDN